MSTAAAQTFVPLTVDEMFALPDDGKRYELFEGHPYVVPAPDVDHQYTSKELQYLLTEHIKRQMLGELFNAPLALILSVETYTEPDLVYVGRPRRALIKRRGIEGGADLVVEILSASNRNNDLYLKKDLYERAGIAHYWVIDPKGHHLLAFELHQTAYRLVAEHSEADTFRPLLFPDLAIDLSKLWWEP